MRFLGACFIGFGILLCLTWVLMIPGLLAIGVGALLRISARRC